MAVTEILLFVGLIVFITHALEAVTGFGCTVLAFPFVIFLMKDIEHVKIILSILAWVLAAYFAVTKFKEINWKQFGIIAALAGVGLPVGMLVFEKLDPIILKKALGIFIVLSASVQIIKLYAKEKKLRPMPSMFGYLFLFAGGIVHGAFATGGPLIVLYSAGKIENKGQFRATMCLLWTVLNTILIGQYLIGRKLTVETGRDILFMLPFLVGGIIVGEIIHKKVNELIFKKTVFISLLLVGVIMAFYS